MINSEKKTAELGLIRARIAKLKAETDKLYRETLWYPLVLCTVFMTAAGTVLNFVAKHLF